MKLYSVILSIIILNYPDISFSKALHCPLWKLNKDVPACPPGSILPETFPIGYIVISDKGESGNDPAFTIKLVKQVLFGAGKNTPSIVLPVTDTTFSQVKKSISNLNVTTKKKRKWLNKIIHAKSKPYTWQQDYMQPIIGTAGNLKLRRVANRNSENDFNLLVDSLKLCGVSAGDELGEQGYLDRPGGIPSGEAGGNLQSLPGGICLVGSDYFLDSEWVDYANEVCLPGKNNRIKVPTSWLAVGHTDEILKVIRNKKKQAPCNFSILIASPSKALELLKLKPRENFLEFEDSAYAESPVELMERRLEEQHELRGLCNKWKQFNKSIDKKGCSELSNADILSIFKNDKRLSLYNDLVQKKMDILKDEIIQKLALKFPSCKKIDVLPVPDLFSGGVPVKINNDFELSRTFGASILPNPTNSILVNDTIISPEPGNNSFRIFLEKEYRKRGLTPKFIDTFDYGLGSGNAHCVTNTFHLCQKKDIK